VRDKRDLKAEGVQAEGRRPEVGDSEHFSLSLQPASAVTLHYWFNQTNKTNQINQLTVFFCWRTFSALC
jgi:hypothetical protein